MVVLTTQLALTQLPNSGRKLLMSFKKRTTFHFLMLHTRDLQVGALMKMLHFDNMTNKWHVYMTKDGRISLARLSLAKCEYLADAIIDSYHNVS
ncbi:hypothetical protein AAC387_Pa02g1557 [Persea americana]